MASFFPAYHASRAAVDVTTSIFVSICGDGIVQVTEACDDGAGNNTGAYASSTSERTCNATCSGFGPYCGDDILQVRFDEECDDGNNTSNDFCSASCREEDLPPGGSSVRRGHIPPEVGEESTISAGIATKVIINGKAYPSTDVTILLDGEVLDTVRTDTNADFTYSTFNVTPGKATFGFWADDRNGVRSLTLATTFEVVASAVTTMSGVLLPPTIALSDDEFDRGELLTASGQSVPASFVTAQVDGGEGVTIRGQTDGAGAWAMQVDTGSLEERQFHTVRAFFEKPEDGGGTLQSGYSRVHNFFIGERGALADVEADINGDDRVNLADFSIFLFNWGTDNGASDLNGDGTVNLADFSILLFHWTG